MASKHPINSKKLPTLQLVFLSLSLIIFIVFSRSSYNILDALTLDTQPPVKLKNLHLLLQHEIHGKEEIKIGLVNINSNEEIEYKSPGSVVSTVHVRFDRVRRGTKWEDFFPAQNSSHPTPCLEIPMPPLEDYDDLDVMVVKLPCKGKTGRSGSKDVFRLQVNLVVANVLVASGWVMSEIKRAVYVVFVGSCEPVPEIFVCGDLLRKVDDHWVYKPDAAPSFHQNLPIKKFDLNDLHYQL